MSELRLPTPAAADHRSLGRVASAPPLAQRDPACAFATDERGRALAEYAPSGIPLLRERLWRAALMGLAGGLTGIAIGAAVDQFGRSIDDDAPRPSLSHDIGSRPVNRQGRLVGPAPPVAGRRFDGLTRIGIAPASAIGSNPIARHALEEALRG